MKIIKFQQGGAIPPEQAAPQGAPAEQGSGDPVAQLVEMAMQALQSKDPNIAMAVCEGLVSLVQGGAQGGAPAGGGAPAPEGEPVMMRKGGKVQLVKRGTKMKKSC